MIARSGAKRPLMLARHLPERGWAHVPAFVLIVSIGAFYVFGLRGDQPGGGDFAAYIIHAANMVEGLDYNSSPFIYNTKLRYYPKSYPPVYPLMLAPAFKVFGQRFLPLQVVTTLMFPLFLFVLWRGPGRLLPSHGAIWLLLMTGVSPVFWEFKENIRPDVPFLFFTYVTLLLAQGAVSSEGGEEKSWSVKALRACALGTCIYLAYGTRTVGAVLLPVVTAAWALRPRFPWHEVVIAVVVFVAFAIAQSYVVEGVVTDYLDILARITPGFIVENMLMQLGNMASFFYAGRWPLVQGGVVLTAGVLAILGFVTRVRGGITVYEIFCVFYMAATLFWYGRDIRYLFPLFPLFIYYALLGLEGIPCRSVMLRRATAAVFLGAIFVMYALRFSTLDFRTVSNGVSRPEAAELYGYVRDPVRLRMQWSYIPIAGPFRL